MEFYSGLCGERAIFDGINSATAAKTELFQLVQKPENPDAIALVSAEQSLERLGMPVRPEVLLLVRYGTLAGAEDFVKNRGRGQMYQNFLRRLLPFKAGRIEVRRHVVSHDVGCMSTAYLEASLKQSARPTFKRLPWLR